MDIYRRYKIGYLSSHCSHHRIGHHNAALIEKSSCESIAVDDVIESIEDLHRCIHIEISNR